MLSGLKRDATIYVSVNTALGEFGRGRCSACDTSFYIYRLGIVWGGSSGGGRRCLRPINVDISRAQQHHSSIVHDMSIDMA